VTLDFDTSPPLGATSDPMDRAPDGVAKRDHA
jgi:hypothetical protein